MTFLGFSQVVEFVHDAQFLSIHESERCEFQKGTKG